MNSALRQNYFWYFHLNQKGMYAKYQRVILGLGKEQHVN